MPILILGGIVIIALLAYIFITNHKEKFVREKPSPRDPFDVIYLPADLDEEKRKQEQRESPPSEDNAQ